MKRGIPISRTTLWQDHQPLGINPRYRNWWCDHWIPSNSEAGAIGTSLPWTFVATHRDFVLQDEGIVGAGLGVVVSMEVCTSSAGTRQPAGAVGVLPVSGQGTGPPPRRTFLPTPLIASDAADVCWLLCWKQRSQKRLCQSLLTCIPGCENFVRIFVKEADGKEHSNACDYSGNY